MVGTYKLKAQTIQAIEVTDPFAQAADICQLIGAQAFIADLPTRTVSFTLADGSKVEVTESKVISVSGGSVEVHSFDEFYEMYEPEAR